MGELIEAWREKSPDHFGPWVARGNHRFAMASHYRGGKWAHLTSEAQFSSMREYHQAAALDFEEALKRRPKLLVALGRLITIAESLTTSERTYLVRALAVCPLCYTVRERYMSDITPRWGGSQEEMEAFVEEVRPRMRDNPRLAWLAGFPDWDRCRTLRRRKQPGAIQACEAAIALGEAPRFFVERARQADVSSDPDKRIAWLERALRIEPQHRTALRKRHFDRADAGDYLGAAEDLITLRHVDPLELSPERVTWMVDMLRYQGDQLRKAGGHRAALPYFSRGLQIAPDANDLRARSGWSQKTITKHGGELPAVKGDDFESLLARDHALAAQGNFAGVVAMWDGYLRTHADDPRAHAERAGAKWHQGLRQEAIEDMRKSCSLGLDKSCQDVTRMQAR